MKQLPKMNEGLIFNSEEWYAYWDQRTEDFQKWIDEEEKKHPRREFTDRDYNIPLRSE